MTFNELDYMPYKLPIHQGYFTDPTKSVNGLRSHKANLVIPQIQGSHYNVKEENNNAW